MAMTVGHSGHRWFGRHAVAARGPAVRVLPSSLVTTGMVVALVSAWGAIVPYVGPAFGYSGDGSGSWTWTLSHAVLGLIPGAVGLLAGLAIIRRASATTIGLGRVSLATAGLVALVCGAWFVIGPSAWPVLENTRAYFASVSPLRGLANAVGYSLGTGSILVAGGGFALGWAFHRGGRTGIGEGPATPPREA